MSSFYSQIEENLLASLETTVQINSKGLQTNLFFTVSLKPLRKFKLSKSVSLSGSQPTITLTIENCTGGGCEEVQTVEHSLPFDPTGHYPEETFEIVLVDPTQASQPQLAKTKIKTNSKNPIGE